MTVRILFVCTANICRSPTAQLLLTRRVGILESADVRVASAGTRATLGQPWCDVAAQWVGAGSDVGDLQKQHAAQPLTADLVESADLVMTADRTHRGAAVRLIPSSRGRVFTFREAAVLAEEATRDLQTDHAKRPHNHQGLGTDAAVEDHIRWLVQEMDAKRGLVQLDDRTRRRGWQVKLRRQASPASDIPDPHGEGGVRHGQALSMLSTALDSWTSSLDSLVCLPNDG